MKKILALLLMVVMSFTLFTGCSDPLYDDLESFINTQMTEVNENYEKIKAEAGGWEDLEDDADLEASIKEVLLPLADDSLEKLEKINPKTEDVKELKDKYVKVMEAYKEGFVEILEGVQEQDENKMTAGNEKIENGLGLLEEYNAALEALVKEVGGEIEY